MNKEELDAWFQPRSWREYEKTLNTDSRKLWESQLELFHYQPTHNRHQKEDHSADSSMNKR